MGGIDMEHTDEELDEDLRIQIEIDDRYNMLRHKFPQYPIEDSVLWMAIVVLRA